MDAEVTERNLVGLALKNPDDQQPNDSMKRGCLDEGLPSVEDLDPILESRMSREGNQVNAHKGKKTVVGPNSQPSLFPRRGGEPSPCTLHNVLWTWLDPANPPEISVKTFFECG